MEINDRNSTQYDELSMPEWILHSAFRYALGRRTAIVSMTCDEIARHIPQLSEEVREMLIRELCEAFDAHKRGVPYALGDDCDIENWSALLQCLKAKYGK